MNILIQNKIKDISFTKFIWLVDDACKPGDAFPWWVAIIWNLICFQVAIQLWSNWPWNYSKYKYFNSSGSDHQCLTRLLPAFLWKKGMHS